MRLLDYCTYMEVQVARPASRDTELLYLFEDAPPPELLADLHPPSHLSCDLLEEAARLCGRPSAGGVRVSVGVSAPAGGPGKGGGEGRSGDSGRGKGDCDIDGSDGDGRGGSIGGGGAGNESDEDCPDLLDERMWLVVGPAGSGCRWHQDPFETAAWNALLHGRKLWFLAPAPAREWSNEVIYDHLVRTAGAPGYLRCVQEAGDLLFVPNLWTHAAICLGDCIGVAHEL